MRSRHAECIFIMGLFVIGNVLVVVYLADKTRRGNEVPTEREVDMRCL